jgi:hypothetical protein
MLEDLNCWVPKMRSIDFSVKVVNNCIKASYPWVKNLKKTT